MKKEIKKEWFLDRYCNQQFAALVEDGRLTEFQCEQEPRGVCVGDIYKGRVVNVLSGMNAAFIHCGLEKNCYLSTEETYTDYTKYDGALKTTESAPLKLKIGDEIIVQVTKPPRGTKGAKVTTHLSFVGKRLIYLPNTDFVGISRKITDETTRHDLLFAAEKMRASEQEGYIIRTQAPFATLQQLKSEAAYLKKLYNETLTFAKKAPVGSAIYQDDDLPCRVMRDCFGDEISAIHVGDRELYLRLSRLIKLRKDISPKKLLMYTGDRSMLESYNIQHLVYNAASPIVPLENGGSLVIEHTEAMTVIDVNTGSYIGANSLEETVFEVNLAATEEIARQVRLRNIGGIIVVDFIDMQEETHKLAITNALTAHLQKDSAKCNVLPMSELCLTQFTRKRVGHDARSYLVKPCPHCSGMGHVHEDIFVVTAIRTKLLACFADGYSSAIVELNNTIMEKILNEGLLSIEAKNRWKEKRIYLIPHKTYREDSYTVRGTNETDLRLPENAQLLY